MAAAVLIVVRRMGTSDGAVTCVAPIPSPCPIVAGRGTGVPGRRPDAPVCASHSCGYPARKPQPLYLKTTINSRNILLVSFYLRSVRSRHRDSAAGGGQLPRGHRKGAGHGPHRPDHHRRAHSAHGARGARYPGEAAGANASRRPGPGSARIPRRDIVSTFAPAMSRPPATPTRHWQSPTTTWQHCPANPPEPRPRRERQQPVWPCRQQQHYSGQWRHVEEAARLPDAHACRPTGSACTTSALAMTQRRLGCVKPGQIARDGA